MKLRTPIEFLFIVFFVCITAHGQRNNPSEINGVLMTFGPDLILLRTSGDTIHVSRDYDPSPILNDRLLNLQERANADALLKNRKHKGTVEIFAVIDTSGRLIHFVNPKHGSDEFQILAANKALLATKFPRFTYRGKPVCAGIRILVEFHASQ